MEKMEYRQIDCFKRNMKFWWILGILPVSRHPYYKFYSKIIFTTFIVIYDSLLSVNFFFLPRQLDIFIGEMVFYFTELAVCSKVLTFFYFRDKIENILDTLECDTFKADSDIAVDIIKRAKLFTIRYWKIIAVGSLISHFNHILPPIFLNLFLNIKLELPVCSYSFIPEYYREMFVYILYFYQGIGIHFHVLYNINIDTFFLGLLVLTIAQLKILDVKLRNVTDCKVDEQNDRTGKQSLNEKEATLIKNLNQCIIHYDVVAKFCKLIEDVFSFTLFVQFTMASCIICVCLFRFTLPAQLEYYLFLAAYMIIMILQIMGPCWFGTRINETSNLLSLAAYNCNWTPRSPQFKKNLRMFVERANKPMTITSGKMFLLSLATFTSIMNSAYSFFTLLRYMQTRET